MCNEISIRKPLVDISHIQLFWFSFIFSRSFSCKAPRLTFSFLPPVNFEIFTAGSFGWISTYPSLHWLKKSHYSSPVFYLRGNIGNVKEKPTRKTCFSREKKRLTLHASTLQNFAKRHFFNVNEISLVFSWEIVIKTGESVWKGLIWKALWKAL